MSRHHKWVRNREQSMLLRTVAEIGADVDVTHYYSHIQGKTPASFSRTYDRDRGTMS
jgi:hypothetical protein